MSFRLTHDLPEKCVIAVSGGVDSMCALHWLSQVKGRVAGVVHVNHNTGDFADESQELVEHAVLNHPEDLQLHVYRINRDPEEGASLENFWREQRYRWFRAASLEHGNLPVVLAHTLDDCLETYVKSTMIDGHLGTIPYSHGPCIRPFRLWKRRDIEIYAKKNFVKWIEDPTNRDHSRFQRAKIRSLVVPRLRNLNPGIYKLVEKAVYKQDEYDHRRHNGENPS